MDVEPVTHCATLKAPENALAINRDTSQVVVAGRNGFPRPSLASRPAERANPVGLDINPYGDMAIAFKRIHHRDAAQIAKEVASSTQKTTNFPAVELPTFFEKSTSSQEKTSCELSALKVLKNGHELLSMDWFVETAKRYQLHGKPLPDLCEHNANVAAQLKRPDVSQTWLILKIMFTSGSMLMSEYSPMGTQDKVPEEKALESSPENSFNNTLRLNNDRNINSSGKSGSRHVSGGSHADERGGGDHAGQMEEDSNSGNTEHENSIPYFASEFAQDDFFFGDREAELCHMLNSLQLSSLLVDEDWTLPREAFEVRHRLGDLPALPEITNMPSSPLRAAEEISDHENVKEEEQNVRLASDNAPSIPPWNFTPIVVDMLYYYAEQGDVQMSVSVLIVIGEKIRYSIDEKMQENWFYSYLDLLSRYKLWNISDEVITLSNLPAINSLNQHSTVIHSKCGKCNKQMTGAGWYCHGCKHVSVCSICHQIVKGVFVWCQGCAHGGHLMHLKDWFKENQECPTGCGHLCEYT